MTKRLICKSKDKHITQIYSLLTRGWLTSYGQLWQILPLNAVYNWLPPDRLVNVPNGISKWWLWWLCGFISRWQPVACQTYKIIYLKSEVACSDMTLQLVSSKKAEKSHVLQQLKLVTYSSFCKEKLQFWNKLFNVYYLLYNTAVPVYKRKTRFS